MKALRHSKTGRNSFENAREEMVKSQIIAGGIKDRDVIQAMLKVPRHRFVPSDLWYSAYGDFPLPIGEGQTISQPYIVALMTEALEIKADDRILEIGTGSGYQSAILAELAKEVYTIERIEKLAKQTELLLTEIGYTNIKIKIGDGTCGWEEFAPYDGIIVTAGAPSTVPEPLFNQLKEGRNLVIPLESWLGQELVVIKKKNGKPVQKNLCGCSFVRLIGKYGWKQ